MQQLADIFGSLPFILGVALFVGIVVLVRLLLSPGGSLERRRTRRDRRRTQAMPKVPFYDSERVLVTQDRRAQADRRKPAFVFTTTQRRRA